MRRSVVLASVTTLAAAFVVAALPQSAGAATPTCFGKTVTIMGTAGADTLTGTPSTDVIYGGGGNDIIWASGESIAGDFLCGGPGADSITGSFKDDKVNGGDGDDYVDGGSFGIDVVQGNAGNDHVDDSSACDYDLDGSPGVDILRGGIGDDSLCAIGGSVKMYGDAGNDCLQDWNQGGDKAWLYGGSGNDQFRSYDDTDSDFVSGDAGTDLAEVNREDTVTTSTERVVRIEQGIGGTVFCPRG